jgi:hypothetical protein
MFGYIITVSIVIAGLTRNPVLILLYGVVCGFRLVGRNDRIVVVVIVVIAGLTRNPVLIVIVACGLRLGGRNDKVVAVWIDNVWGVRIYLSC